MNPAVSGCSTHTGGLGRLKENEQPGLPAVKIRQLVGVLSAREAVTKISREGFQ